MKKDKTRKYPEEMLLMKDCPRCDNGVNKMFVEDVVDRIAGKAEQSAYDKAIEVIRGLQKEDIVSLKNGQYISIVDAEIGEYNQALQHAILEINKLKDENRKNMGNAQ